MTEKKPTLEYATGERRRERLRPLIFWFVVAAAVAVITAAAVVLSNHNFGEPRIRFLSLVFRPPEARDQHHCVNHAVGYLPLEKHRVVQTVTLVMSGC